jgi:predicted RNA binding protein YcfA (HicA-like mRNA interferase family)
MLKNQTRHGIYSMVLDKMKLNNLKSKKVVKAFERMGMIKVRQSGTHVILKGNIKGIEKTLVIPIHHREIAEGTMTDILNNQAEISREEFFKYY